MKILESDPECFQSYVSALLFELKAGSLIYVNTRLTHCSRHSVVCNSLKCNWNPTFQNPGYTLYTTNEVKSLIIQVVDSMNNESKKKCCIVCYGDGCGGQTLDPCSSQHIIQLPNY